MHKIGKKNVDISYSNVIVLAIVITNPSLLSYHSTKCVDIVGQLIELHIKYTSLNARSAESILSYHSIMDASIFGLLKSTSKLMNRGFKV